VLPFRWRELSELGSMTRKWWPYRHPAFGPLACP